MNFSNNSLPADFPDDQENLLRGVSVAIPHLWKDRRPSSAAFKDSNGLSVDRAANRSLDEAIMYARGHLPGYAIVSISVGSCRNINATLKYKPEQNNPYHSEIHRNETTIPLSASQARHLAVTATILYKPEEPSSKTFLIQ